MNKIDEIHKFLIDRDTDIAIITESWLTPKFQTTKYRQTRRTTNHLLIALYKDTPIEDTPQSTPYNVEILTIMTNIAQINHWSGILFSLN